MNYSPRNISHIAFTTRAHTFWFSGGLSYNPSMKLQTQTHVLSERHTEVDTSQQQIPWCYIELSSFGAPLATASEAQKLE